MACGGDSVEAELAEKREQDILDQFVFTAGVQVAGQCRSAFHFGGRKWVQQCLKLGSTGTTTTVTSGRPP